MKENRIVMEFENAGSPEELAAARQERGQFDQNRVWLQSHILEIGDSRRGKCIFFPAVPTLEWGKRRLPT